MNSTSVTTKPAVLRGSTSGPSQAIADTPPMSAVVTTSGWVTVPAGPVRRAEVPLNLLDRLFELLNRSARSHAADVVDLRADVRTIGGKLVAHAGHLAIHTVPGQAQEREDQDDRRQNGGHPSDSPLQRLDGGVRTNVSSTARQTGTRTACAQ